MKSKYLFVLTISFFLITCSSDSEKARDYINQGINKTLSAKPDLKGALKDFDNAVKLAPELAEAYFYRGSTKFNMGNIPAALEDYNKAIELKPDYADAYFNRGNLKFYNGDEQGACSDWLKAEALGKENMLEKTRRCK